MKSTRTTTTRHDPERLEWHRWKGCQPPPNPSPSTKVFPRITCSNVLLPFGVSSEGRKGSFCTSTGRTSSSDCQPVIACQLLAFRVIKLIWRGTGKLDGTQGWFELAASCPVFPLFPRNFPGGFRKPLPRPVSASIRSSASLNDNLDRRVNGLTLWSIIVCEQRVFVFTLHDGEWWKSLVRLSLEVNEWFCIVSFREVDFNRLVLWGSEYY